MDDAKEPSKGVETVSIEFDLGVFVPEAKGVKRSVVMSKDHPRWKKGVELVKILFDDSLLAITSASVPATPPAKPSSKGAAGG